MHFNGLPGGTSGKDSVCKCKLELRDLHSLGEEDPLEEHMATYVFLPGKIPPEETGDPVHGVAKNHT